MFVDHRDIAEAAFVASGLPPTPPDRAVESVLPYITILLGMLPPEEEAGYVLAPPDGENVAFLADGTPVRISRVMYPDGQMYKVMNNAPNGGPQWVLDDVNEDLYVPFDGDHTPPPDQSDLEQRVTTLEGQVATLQQQLADFVNWTHEVTKQIGVQNTGYAYHDGRIVTCENRLGITPPPPPVNPE
jgi:hypothetical protein